MRKALPTLALLLAPALPAQQTDSRPQPTEIKVWGFNGATPLLLRWEAAYAAAHPGVRYTNTLNGPASAMAGLYNGVADLVLMGREIWPVDTMAYHWVFQHQPFGIAVVTSTQGAPAQAFTPVVIVNRANPIKSITLAQLDAVYGSEHRAAPANARTWAELGVAGPLAPQTIHPVGYGPEDALGVYFRHDILKSDFKPNPDSTLFSDRDAGARSSAAARISAVVAQDPRAIGYTAAESLGLKVKTISVAGVAATAQGLLDHSYPLTRSIYLYVNRVPGKALPPALDDFLHFVLSPRAQVLVAPAEGYLPLTDLLAQQQRDRLEQPMPPEKKADVQEDK